jgi:hypothetical protein
MPKQNISAVNIPDSGILRAIAIRAKDSTLTVEGSVPTELLPLALEIIALARKLQAKCDSYDSRAINAVIRANATNSAETKRLRNVEREKRVAKETDRLRGEEVKKLKGIDKRFYRQTGLTPDEHFQRLMQAAQALMGMAEDLKGE